MYISATKTILSSYFSVIKINKTAIIKISSLLFILLLIEKLNMSEKLFVFFIPFFKTNNKQNL